MIVTFLKDVALYEKYVLHGNNKKNIMNHHFHLHGKFIPDSNNPTIGLFESLSTIIIIVITVVFRGSV